MESLQKPYHNTVSELCNLSVSKAFQVLSKKTPKCVKTTACSYHCPIRDSAPTLEIWCTVNTFGTTIQARAIPPPSWIYVMPVTTGRLYSLQLGVPNFSSTEKAIIFTNYYCVLILRSKNEFLLCELV